MSDLVLDTGALADLLAQYFDSADRNNPMFYRTRWLPEDAVRTINRIVRVEGRYVVAASTLAFVEIVRKWDEIVAGRFRPEQMAAFLEDPPDWFAVEPLDEGLIPFFGQVPWRVTDSSRGSVPLEWTDVVHLATARSRERASLVTTDGRLQNAMAALNASIHY